MIRDGKVNGFVSDQVTKRKIRGHNDSPVEREIAQRGTVSPFRPLAHNVDFARRPMKFADDNLEMLFNFFPRLLA